jgi:hypothetical protein
MGEQYGNNHSIHRNNCTSDSMLSSSLQKMSNRQNYLIRFMYLTFISLVLNSGSFVNALLQEPRLSSMFNNDVRCVGYHRIAAWRFTTKPYALIRNEKQCDVQNQCCLTLSMSSNSDINNGASNMVIDRCAKGGLVWYNLSCIDKKRTQRTQVYIEYGYYLDQIKTKIKEKSAKLFQNVDAEEIMIYESINSIEQLDETTEWTSSVSWGTKDAPLLIKVNSGTEGMIIFCSTCCASVQCNYCI